MISPFKCNSFRVTSPYGERILNGVKNYHAGIDLVGIGSSGVCAVAAGKVVVSQIVTDKSNKTWEWGNYICVYGDDGRYYYYCHLASRGVAVGARVEKGQTIGVMGNTGYSFGAHLHFEVRGPDGRTTVDPAEVLGIENAVGIYEAAKEEESEVRYKYIDDVPLEEFRDVLNTLVRADILRGSGFEDGKRVIDLSHDMVRNIVFEYRGGAFDRKLVAMGMAPAVKG